MARLYVAIGKKQTDMRKLFFTMVCLMAVAGLSAQNNIMNSDFEIWSYGKPVNWTVGLHGTITSYVNIPIEVNFGTQSNDAHAGNSAVMLQSADFTIPYVGYSFNLPGILQAGESEGFSIPLEDIMAIIQMFQDTTGTGSLDSTDLTPLLSLAQLLSPGVPCTTTPTAVSAWVKYQPQDDDQLVMLAITKKDGAPVDYAYKMMSTDNPSVYENVGVTFENPGEECDSIMIVIMSAMSLNSTSVLYVDDVSLVYSGVGVAGHKDFSESLYPNPTSDVLNIDVEGVQEYHWTIRDLTGRTLQSGRGAGKTTLNVKDYPAGIYMLTLNVNGSERTRKVVVR